MLSYEDKIFYQKIKKNGENVKDFLSKTDKRIS